MKRIFRIIVIGVPLGFALLFFQKSLQIDRDVFMRGYWISALVIIVGMLLINIIYNISYQKKIQQAVKLLDEGKPQEYISEVESLLKTAKGQTLRNVLALNLAAGYMEIKEFDKAIPMLEELSDKRLTGSVIKLVHQINLCMSYFEVGNSEKAMALYDKNRRLFERYKNDRTYGASIAVLDIFAMIENKQYEQAGQLLDAAQKTCDRPRFQETFCEIAHILDHVKDIQQE